MSTSPAAMLSAHTFTPLCRTMSHVEKVELNEIMTGNSWSEYEVGVSAVTAYVILRHEAGWIKIL